MKNDVTEMQTADVSEIIRIFEVMKNHGVKCSAEFQITGNLDPFISYVDQPVTSIERFERVDDCPASVILQLGDNDFNFEEDIKCGKDITDYQIFLSIANDHYCAWFSTGAVSPEVIAGVRDCTQPVYPDNDYTYDEKVIKDFAKLFAINPIDTVERVIQQIKDGSR